MDRNIVSALLVGGINYTLSGGIEESSIFSVSNFVTNVAVDMISDKIITDKLNQYINAKTVRDAILSMNTDDMNLSILEYIKMNPSKFQIIEYINNYLFKTEETYIAEFLEMAYNAAIDFVSLLPPEMQYISEVKVIDIMVKQKELILEHIERFIRDNTQIFLNSYYPADYIKELANYSDIIAEQIINILIQIDIMSYINLGIRAQKIFVESVLTGLISGFFGENYYREAVKAASISALSGSAASTIFMK